MDKFSFENQFGKATLHRATGFLPIGDVSYRKTPEVAENMFDIETAERLALITENRGIQIAYVPPGRCYVVVHKASNVVAVCRAEIEEFHCSQSAAQQIEDFEMDVGSLGKRELNLRFRGERIRIVLTQNEF